MTDVEAYQYGHKSLHFWQKWRLLCALLENEDGFLYCFPWTDRWLAAKCYRATHTLSIHKANTDDYWYISDTNNDYAAIASFYYPIRAPPLLKFWFSQNFKRLEETPCQGAEQKRKKSAMPCRSDGSQGSNDMDIESDDIEVSDSVTVLWEVR